MPLKRTNSDAGQKPAGRLRAEPELKIDTTIFSKRIVLQLADHWIVPALVEEFLRSKRALPESARREHNENQL
jgi:hypothetical protein